MNRKYDYSNGTRGKFYRPGAQLNLPVYLDAKVQAYLSDKASKKGIDLSELVNELLRHDIEIMETGK